MSCTRCGTEEATVTRTDGTYCTTCSTVREWQALIALVQDAQVTTPVAGGDRVLRSA